MTRLRFVLGPGERERLDKVLVRLCEGASRATVQRWVEEGRVRVNGKACRAKDQVGPGAVLEVEPAPPPLSTAEPDAGVRFELLYEDDELLVVNKPAGLVVHPARGHATGTLVNGLLSMQSFRSVPVDPRDPAGVLRPGVVHRIDKGTSGVLVIAKNERVREGLKEQLAKHTVERVYCALTIGVPQAGRIATLYGRHPQNRLKFSSRVAQGKTAVTHVSVLETLAGGRAARIECRLETGRTHQIRVHLTEQTQTPIVGDPLYRPTHLPNELRAAQQLIDHQALHARVLGFVHPTSQERLRFEAPWPADFEAALTALRQVS
ncbi:MAG TPA: RluA family pseudouridine synthase [Polyangiaceae bacterium]|nr:RluA family pseudouridine synthase [Polyangiaceae bacterium]